MQNRFRLNGKIATELFLKMRDAICQDLCQIIEEESKMAELKSSARKKIPKSKFGLPASRKYPVNDRAHAANAKARATQMVKKGKLSSSSASKIRAKANKVLGKKK